MSRPSGLAEGLSIDQIVSSLGLCMADVTDLPTLGAAAQLAVGGANGVVQLTSAGKMPVVDGSALTNLTGVLPAPIVSTYTPTTGTTVSATTTMADETIACNPAGTLAALTFALPSDGNSRTGQLSRFFSMQIITALTVTATGQTIKGTSSFTAFALDGSICYQKIAAATWARLY
jgi:hypothetical protein